MKTKLVLKFNRTLAKTNQEKRDPNDQEFTT